MQPPVATLQTWMDAQDRTNLVWEEQVRSLPPLRWVRYLAITAGDYAGNVVITAAACADDAVVSAATPRDALYW